MSETKDLIIFVPGMNDSEPEVYLKKLVDGIRDYCNGKGIVFNNLDDHEDRAGVRNIKVEFSNQTRIIEIREIFWSDLRPRLSHERAMRKLIRGLDLLFYWFGALKVWSSVRQSKYMIFNILFTLLIFVSWYYGAIAAAITAIGTSPDVLGYKLSEEWVNWFKNIGIAMGSWKIWLFVSILMAIIPVSAIIDISFATKCYLQNRLGLKHKINARLYKALSGVNNNKDLYSHVTLLSHSFGVVVATETIAEFDQKNLPVKQLITMGGPLEIIKGRSDRVRIALEHVENYLRIGKLENWTDFYSDYDWLCSKSPVSDDIENFNHHKISTTVPLDKRANGASHSMYFTDWDVMKEIVKL